MLPRSLSLARLTALSALLMGLSLGCGGSEPPAPPPWKQEPDATRSTVEVSRARDVLADGQDTSTIRVTVRDTTGAVIAGVPVELRVWASPAATVTPDEGVTDNRGVVTAALRATSPGGRTVSASVRGANGTVALTARPTVDFVRSPTAATRLAFLSQPGTRPVRGPLATVRVRLVDAEGNTVLANAPRVTLALRGGAGTLGGVTTVSPVEGVASFDGLTVDAEGTGYTLVASAQGLTEATSDAFDITGTDLPLGAGANGGLDFEASELGVLTVDP